MEEKAFHSRVIDGKRFVAFPISYNPGNWWIVDEWGNNYGAYWGLDEFEKRHRKEPVEPIGKVQLSARVVGT